MELVKARRVPGCRYKRNETFCETLFCWRESPEGNLRTSKPTTSEELRNEPKSKSEAEPATAGRRSARWRAETRSAATAAWPGRPARWRPARTAEPLTRCQTNKGSPARGAGLSILNVRLHALAWHTASLMLGRS